LLWGFTTFFLLQIRLKSVLFNRKMGCLKLTYQTTETPLNVAFRKSEESENTAQRFLSVDPLADQFPAWSPYNFVLGNPINLIDPDGRAPVPPDEFNVDRNTGKITKISNKGGSETDFFNVGMTNSEGSFVTEQTLSTQRGTGSINTFRFTEDSKGTVSSFVIPGEGTTGFLLEPGGPSTTVAKQDKRIPEGQFSLILSKDRPGVDASKLRFPNNFVLFNGEVSSGRGITFHSGNFNDQTEGCPMPGCGFGIGRAGDAQVTPSRVGFLRTTGSKPKLGELNRFIKQAGPENVKVNIFNVIPDNEK